MEDLEGRVGLRDFGHNCYLLFPVLDRALSVTARPVFVQPVKRPHSHRVDELMAIGSSIHDTSNSVSPATFMHPRPNKDVERVFQSHPRSVRTRLYFLRNLILSTAASTKGVGLITETLKWGEPAYLTEKSRSGSTIRIGWKATAPSRYAMYFNCQTKLVDTFRTLFPELTFEGNRAVLFEEHDELPVEAVTRCIELALTYHLWKKQSA
jgi:hypothetical protein